MLPPTQQLWHSHLLEQVQQEFGKSKYPKFLVAMLEGNSSRDVTKQKFCEENVLD